MSVGALTTEELARLHPAAGPLTAPPGYMRKYPGYWHGPAATAAREARSEVEALRARVAELEAEVTRLRAPAATMTGVAP